MILKLETRLNDGSSNIFHVNDSMNMHDAIEYICSYYGLETAGVYLDSTGSDCTESMTRYVLSGGKKSIPGIEFIDMDRVRIGYVLENIGDRATLVSGYSAVDIKVKGIAL